MKKIRIAICSGNHTELSSYESLCKKLYKQYNVLMEYKTYTSGRTLLFDLQNPLFCKKLDAIFFALCDENTKDLIKLFREVGYEGLIILIGDIYENLSAEELFDYRIFNAVKSNREVQRFSDVFEKAIDAIAKTREEKIAVSYGGDLRYIALSDILYFEKKERGLVVHYNDNESFFFISTIAKLEQQLKGRNFYRVSVSHFILLDAIDKVIRNNRDCIAVMRDGAEVPIGRKYFASVKDAIKQEAI